jgi:outer membrane receptor protein involved in Fe transport
MNEPLIGVNVLVKETTTGNITDLNGEFTIMTDHPNPILVISYIGYITQEVRVRNEQNLNIILKPDELGLEEVVVVGYGAVKKKDLTGSVASVNAEKIAASPSTSAIQAIQGRIPGVYIANSTTKPGESASVLIRGKRSISGSSDPLYIVDGIPIVGGLNEINLLILKQLIY